MSQRTAQLSRKTKETDISISVNLDGTGESTVCTGIGFFDHMLTHLAKHSLCDINIKCSGDLDVDGHHTVEDIGIALGKLFASAWDDKTGIVRYGSAIIPMDEALVMCAVDLSGRGFVNCKLNIDKDMIGSFDTELVPEFFRALCNNAGINAHIIQIEGSNAHHIVEAAFKAFAKSLRKAISLDKQIEGIPSTKGVL